MTWFRPQVLCTAPDRRPADRADRIAHTASVVKAHPSISHSGPAWPTSRAKARVHCVVLIVCQYLTFVGTRPKEWFSVLHLCTRSLPAHDMRHESVYMRSPPLCGNQALPCPTA